VVEAPETVDALGVVDVHVVGHGVGTVLADLRLGPAIELVAFALKRIRSRYWTVLGAAMRA
jgi:hypothetical protein